MNPESARTGNSEALRSILPKSFLSKEIWDRDETLTQLGSAGILPHSKPEGTLSPTFMCLLSVENCGCLLPISLPSLTLISQLSF